MSNILDQIEDFFIVIKTNNTLWGVGFNTDGQLGTGNTVSVNALTPMNVTFGTRIPLFVSYGLYHTIVLMNDNTLWGTGRNSFGQLGTGNTINVNTLTKMNVTFGSSIPLSISCGSYHTIVLMNDNTLWYTGNGSNNGNVLTKMNFTVGVRNPLYVSCGKGHTIVLMDDNTIWGTGYNSDGQLGTGDTINVNTLTQMNFTVGVRNPLYVSCGSYHTIVIMNDNTLWGTGYNSDGQLGTGDTINVNTLTQMNVTFGSRIPSYISCGSSHTIVLMNDNTLWGTGDNSVGQLGTGDTTNVNTLTQMNVTFGSKIPLSISCGSYNTIVLMKDTTLWGTGNNSIGQLGAGNIFKTSLTNLGNDFKFINGMLMSVVPSIVSLSTLVDFLNVSEYETAEVHSALSANITFEPNFTVLTLPYASSPTVNEIANSLTFTGTYNAGTSYSFLLDNYALYFKDVVPLVNSYTLNSPGIGAQPITLTGTFHKFTNGVFANYTALIVTDYKIGAGTWNPITPGTLLTTLNTVFSTNNANKSLKAISPVDTLEGTEVNLALGRSTTTILKEYVSIVTNDEFPVPSITLNLNGFDKVNNLTTFLGLSGTPKSIMENFTVYVTPAQMFSYFTDNKFNSKFLQDALAHNVDPYDVISGVTGINSVANLGKVSFGTGCLDASGNNLIENVIMYISKCEINSDNAYAVMDPISKQQMAEQIATFGALACNDFWQNTAVATQMINCFKNIGRVSLSENTFVSGDVYIIYGKIKTCSSQSNKEKTGLRSYPILDYTFTISITVINVIPPTSRSIPTIRVYKSLSYDTVAPSGPYTFETSFSNTNTDTLATSYSYGKSV